MSDNLSDIWKLKRRAKLDSERHKELIRKVIKEKGKDLITEYDVIKSDGNKKIKVPIKFLDRYKFKYGTLNDEQNVGQGLSGKKGDKYKVGNKSQDKNSPGDKAGDEAGEKVYEAEVDLDELVNILIEELNLPWLEPKNDTVIETEKEEFESIEKKGILPNLDIKRTLIQNLKRNAIQGKATIGKFKQDDFRYKEYETTKEFHSNAAIYLLMDRSGSMTKDKTDIAKTFCFWMVQFIRKRYKHIDIIFIAHDTSAWIETEENFFKISSMGGTKCSSAFELAYENMQQHHPSTEWNNYLIEFSDGDNWDDDNQKCLELVNKLLPLCRAIGYGEIILKQDMALFGPSKKLSEVLEKNINRTRYVSMKFKNKDDVISQLKRFFNIDNISRKSQ